MNAKRILELAEKYLREHHDEPNPLFNVINSLRLTMREEMTELRNIRLSLKDHMDRCDSILDGSCSPVLDLSDDVLGGMRATERSLWKTCVTLAFALGEAGVEDHALNL